jgi:hypothetical protein
MVLGGDAKGNILALQEGVCTDNGIPIMRERTSPHIGRMMNNVIHSRFELDMQSGVGTNGSTPQGLNPQMMLQYSDDGGSTWSDELWMPMGAAGQTFERVRWDSLGCARNRVYRIKYTDPVWVPIIGAQLLMSQGVA